MPRTNKADDETGKARSAAEDAVLRAELAKSGNVHARDNVKPPSRVAETNVDAQMKAQRGK